MIDDHDPALRHPTALPLHPLGEDPDTKTQAASPPAKPAVSVVVANLLDSIKTTIARLEPGADVDRLLADVGALEEILLPSGASAHRDAVHGDSDDGRAPKRESLESTRHSPTSEIAISARSSRSRVSDVGLDEQRQSVFDLTVIDVQDDTLDNDALLSDLRAPLFDTASHASSQGSRSAASTDMPFSRLSTGESVVDADANTRSPVPRTATSPVSAADHNTLVPPPPRTPSTRRPSLTDPTTPSAEAAPLPPSAATAAAAAAAAADQGAQAAQAAANRVRVDGCMDIFFLYNGTLGFTVAGGEDHPLQPNDPKVYVTAVLRDGAADRDGRLQVGDALIQVHGVAVAKGFRRDAVTSLLRSRNTWVAMRVLRQPGTLQRQVHVIELPPTPADGLGFSISGGVDFNALDGSSDSSAESDTPSPASSPPHPPRPHSRPHSPSSSFKGAEGSPRAGTRPTPGLRLAVTEPVVCVSSISSAGLAGRDGRLWVGDWLLTVNDEPLTGCTHAQAVERLKAAAALPAPVRLAVERFVESPLAETLYDLTLHPIAGAAGATVAQSFGFTIAGGTDQPVDGVDPSIYIVHVEPGSAAEVIHRLRFGDRIVEVAGQPLHRATHATATSAFFQPPVIAGAGVRVRVARLPAVDDSRERVWHFAVARGGPGHELGFTIAGGIDDMLSTQDGSVYVTSVAPGGAFARADPTVQVGDRILVANGQSLCNVRHATAAAILRSNPLGLTLTLTRWVGAAHDRIVQGRHARRHDHMQVSLLRGSAGSEPPKPANSATLAPLANPRQRARVRAATYSAPGSVHESPAHEQPTIAHAVAAATFLRGSSSNNYNHTRI